MRTRLNRALATVATAATALALSTTNAAAAGPWQPYPEGDLTLVAGSYCDFTVTAHPVAQGVKYRTVESYPDGTPKVQEFTGPLRVLFTNTANGAHTTLNLSGHAIVTYRQDGSMAQYETRGPVGFGFHAGDGFPKGYYRLLGRHVMTFDPDGTRHLVVDQGAEQNICTMLS